MFGQQAMVDITMITVTAMVTSQVFSLCPLVLLMIAASLHGMLNPVHQHLLLLTAAVKREVQTSRLSRLIYITHAREVTLGLRQLLLWRQVCLSSILCCYSLSRDSSLLWDSQINHVYLYVYLLYGALRLRRLIGGYRQFLAYATEQGVI